MITQFFDGMDVETVELLAAFGVVSLVGCLLIMASLFGQIAGLL